MPVFRVTSVNPAANTKATTWVRAPTKQQAKRYVREQYSRHMIESALERTPPEDADVESVHPRRSEPADFGGGELTGVQEL